ncbi:hypothetical protein L7F22_031150 [Adiantum nelumboides]|nr:hypothetical protein [Adiantum nelumboides]
MENRVALKEALPTKLARYPCAIEESANLQFHRKFGEHNQEILEGPPPSKVHRLPPFKANLEPIVDIHENERGGSKQSSGPMVVPDSEDEMMQGLHQGPKDLIEQSFIPSLDETLATQLWEEVREKLTAKGDEDKPPLSAIALSHEWDHLESEQSIPIWEKASDVASEGSVLKTLPEFVGDYEAKTEIIHVPMSNIHEDEPERDSANLQALMSAPVTCTIPLADLLKIRPNLWKNVAELSKVGEFCTKHKIEPELLKRKMVGKQQKPMPINAISMEISDNELGNITIPVCFNDYKAIAILDTGAGVSIATKSIWEKWGKLALRKTRMQLQLADGKMAKPLGMLEHITVTSCGIEYVHTFVIVDFGKDPNYEVILGRPFMRQMLTIQNWGYNYLYLRHDGVITRVNLSTHDYKDVAKLPVADFESATTSKPHKSTSNYEGEDNLWLFKAAEMEYIARHSENVDKRIEELATHVPQTVPDDDESSQEWMQLLATIDTCALPIETQFCDEEGYEIVPIRVIQPVYHIESTQDSSAHELVSDNPSRDTSEKEFSYYYEEESSNNKEKVLSEDPLKTPECLYHNLDWVSETTKRRKVREKRRAKKARSKGVRRPPTFLGKTEYLLHVEAYDAAKSDHSWKQGIGCQITENPAKDLATKPKSKETNPKKKKRATKINENCSEEGSKNTKQTTKSQKETVKPTKKEIKEANRQCKRALKQAWADLSDSAEELENQEIPDNFKRYTIQDRKIVLETPKRTPQGKLGESYDGPELAKQVDIAEQGEDPKLVWVAMDLTMEEEALLISTLKEYRDVFAWMYKDLKGVDPKVCQHTIHLKEGAKPKKHRPYTYNETFAKKVKEEIDKLLEAKFIYEIEHTEWVSPIVVVPKKNGKLRVCVNLKQVNAVTIRDNYPLPITDHVLERVAGKEAYSFLDGFSGYNQVSIALEDQHKTAFATEWGIFAYRVMAFGLTNAPATFQRLMAHAFKQYLRDFLEIFMDDLCVHSKQRFEHIDHLVKVFVQCQIYKICLNPDKYKFMVRQGKILGHIVSKHGISTDMDKIKVIVDLPIPISPRQVQVFMGHCGYYRRFIYMYAEIARPLYGLLVNFEWTPDCTSSFEKLKKALTSAPILRVPVYDKIFHVHIDASAYAIGCILAQPGEFNKDYPIAYASRQLIAAEKNYTTTEREGLTMIYAVKKFRHYLLANRFIFFVDHQVLLYLVNKPCATGRIVRWFVILLEFDFEVAVKKGSMHQRADHLSRITSGEAAVGVNDDLPDANLFNIEWVPRWSTDVVSFLTTATVPNDKLEEAADFIKASSNFCLIAGHLYYRDNEKS